MFDHVLIPILVAPTPVGIDYEDMKNAILEVRGVTGLFDLHMWSITTGMNAPSTHVVIMDQSKGQSILKEITGILDNKFRITRSTIQIETYHEK